MNTDETRSPATMWFNPFHYLAGAKALGLGLAAILLVGFVGALSRAHFDGVIDTHVGAPAPQWFFLAEGVVDWLCMAALALVAGLIISKTKFRAIDVVGTQALARWPTVFVSLVAFPPGFRRFNSYLLRHLAAPTPTAAFPFADAAVFFAVLLAIIVVSIWTVVLMYQAFSVSCNVRGPKAVGAFVVALLAAELLSKLALGALFALTLGAAPGAVNPAAAPRAAGVEHDGVQIVEFLAKGDFAAVTARFDATMQRALPEAKLRAVWQQLQEQVGPYLARRESRVTRQQGYDVVFVPCQFARATLDAKVVFDADRKIAGLFFVPSQAAAP